MDSRPGSRSHDEYEDFEIDWAVVYDFNDIELSHAIKEYRDLIKDIEDFGLQVQVRHGYGSSVLVLIRVPRDLLGNEVHRSRVKDWLFGITSVRPLGGSATIVDAETIAEELRSVFHLVTWRQEQGGAGITANIGKWERVKASFPPHDVAANSRLMRNLTRKTILTAEDLDEIRALFGEKVAFYYAFIQCYSLFLVVPTLCGALFWFYSRPYSITFGIINCLWGIGFVEYWKKQEVDLSIRWNVRGVGALKVNRVEYKWEKEVVNPTTGEIQKVFPAHKRLLRQLLFFPFAALAGIALGTVLVFIFAMEALVSDVYDGENKEYWGFLPTILLSVSLPYITSALTTVATRLSDHENHRTNDEYDLAQVQKTFVLNFITSFLPIILTAFVYVPYGAKLIPYIVPSSWQAANHIRPNIDPVRLQQEVVYLSMTAQVMDFGEEIVLPYVKSGLWNMYRKYQGRKALHRRQHSRITEALLVDSPQESIMLSRIRGESEAEPYDVQEDILEMCVQFGYLILFGAVWPLMPLGFLLNNWVELRGDFFKLTKECQRPPPIRSDSIGHSVHALEFMTWLGSLSTAALVHIYRGPIEEVRLSMLLLTIFVAEQAYLITKVGVKFIFTKLGSETVRREEARQYMVRKRYLDTFSEESAGTSSRSRSHSDASVPMKALHAGGHVSHEEVEIQTAYKAEAAERFWTENKRDTTTAEIDVRLIVALKRLQDSAKSAASEIDKLE